MRQLLTLNEDGKLALRSGDGHEKVIERKASNVLLLLDTSGSMTGDKIDQARSGAVDFAHAASAKGYATALAVFADRAAMVCDPVSDSATVSRKVAKVSVGMVGGSTDLAAGLALAGKIWRACSGRRCKQTEQSNDNAAALDAASKLKERRVDIICIGTDDADREFLALLATRSDLSAHVSAGQLGAAITEASRLLSLG